VSPDRDSEPREEVAPDAPEGAARATSKPSWLRKLADVAVPVAVAALVATLAMLTPSRGLRFKASSAQDGYAARGWTGIARSDGLTFHTKRQADPWVEIYPTQRTVHRVRVWNRTRSRERAVPLVLEVADSKGGFREVGRETKTFGDRTFTFPPVKTNKIRLRVDGKKTWLHLGRVEVD